MRRRLNYPMLRIIFFFYIGVNSNQQIILKRNLIQINNLAASGKIKTIPCDARDGIRFDMLRVIKVGKEASMVDKRFFYSCCSL
jgi:hypothetical protein